MFAVSSDHKAILAKSTTPSFDTEDTVPRFYRPETILQDPEAREDLETSLKSIKSTGDQWWEEALSCIQKKAVSHQREHKNKKQSVELQAQRFLQGSTRDSVTPAVYQFLSSLGIAATMQQQPTPSWWGCMKRHNVTERAWKHSPSSRGGSRRGKL